MIDHPNETAPSLYETPASSSEPITRVFAWQRKVQQIESILFNMSYLLNLYRPHQARDQLSSILVDQIDRRKTAIQVLERSFEDSREILQDARKILQNSRQFEEIVSSASSSSPAPAPIDSSPSSLAVEQEKEQQQQQQQQQQQNPMEIDLQSAQPQTTDKRQITNATTADSFPSPSGSVEKINLNLFPELAKYLK